MTKKLSVVAAFQLIGLDKMREGARGIQSVEVSARILRALVDGCRPMMLKELAQAADLAPAQCHAYLTSLRHVGFVHQDAATGLYKTGSFALRLGLGWLKGNTLAAAAIRDLRALTEELGIMSLLAAWGTSGPTIIHINSGVSQTTMNLRPGSIFSVTGSATGRAFAAFGALPDLEAQIAADLDRTAHGGGIGQALTRAAFEQRLETARALGYSTAEGSPIPGINAVSAPILGCESGMFFVATLIGPADELAVGPGSVAVQRLVATTSKLTESQDSQQPALAAAF